MTFTGRYFTLVQIEKQEFGLKPMNCPGHCLMFGHKVRSYRGKLLSCCPDSLIRS
jgi:threonyl-tRNA synthetase